MRATLEKIFVILGAATMLLLVANHVNADEPPECIPVNPIPAWQQCHDDWWDCRREFDLVQHDYVRSIGRWDIRHVLLGWPPVQPNENIMGYEVPAHPIESQPNDVEFCLAHLQACHDGIAIFKAEVFISEWWGAYVDSTYFGIQTGFLND
jgi:hypothetical protein